MYGNNDNRKLMNNGNDVMKNWMECFVLMPLLYKRSTKYRNNELSVFSFFLSLFISILNQYFNNNINNSFILSNMFQVISAQF